MTGNKMLSACEVFLKCIKSSDLSPAELAKALECFGISADRVIKAAEELPGHYDLGLEGVRRIIELYIAEFIGLFKDTDSALIYTTHPTPLYVMLLVDNAGKSGVRIKTPGFVAILVLRSFFIWEGNIKGVSDSGFPICGVNQMRLFLIKNKCIDRPAVLWNWGLMCDENCITGRILQQHYSEIESIDIKRLRGSNSKEELFQHLCSQVEKALLEIRRILDLDISEDVERQSSNQWMSLVLIIESITQLNNKHQGRLLGGNGLALVHSIMLTAFSDWTLLMEALELLYVELKNKRNRVEHFEHSNKGYANRACLYCYYVPLTTPQVSSLFARHGINLIGNTAFLFRKAEEFSPKSLNERIAVMCMQILIGGDCDTEAEAVGEQLEKYRCHGYLTGMYAYDRWLGDGQGAIAELIEKKYGYPVYFLEMDFWHSNDLERLETKIKEIAKLITLRKT
jgi:hypothetical protein